MGDKHRSEFQKPVKNTLLSGASHGFPFENFQGSSLLIPVSQGSPSVLDDSVGNVGKDFKTSDNVSQTTESSLSIVSLENTPNVNVSKTTPATASQSYTGLFSSLFGGGSQKKQDDQTEQNERKNSLEISASSSSTIQTPFATIPPVQSFSPSLHVPSTVSEPTLAGFTQPPIPSFPQPQPPPSSNYTLSSSNESSEVSSLFSTTNVGTNQPEANSFHGFFKENNTSNPALSLSNEGSATDIGFESFYNSMPGSNPSSTVLAKTQSAIDLVGGNHKEISFSNQPGFSVEQHSSAPQFYQTRTVSADSLPPFQPPPSGVPPSQSAPLPAPPMLSGSSTRNYRRDHHKRVVYAPVPGLTSNTVVSSSFLQPCENFSTPNSASSSALISPSGTMKPSFSGSLSQPVLNISDISSTSNILANSSSTSKDSLQNFFISQSSTATTECQPSNIFTAAINSPLNPPNSLTICTQNTTPKTNSQTGLPSNAPTAPPPAAGPFVMSPHSVHPPIMSTREQTQPVTTRPKSPPVIIPASLNNLANLGTSGIIYRPVYHHWFIKTVTKDGKEIWQPFSMTDSLALEHAFNSDTLTPETLIPTDGGRYDVNIVQRIRIPVYWEEEPKTVRRCSWFYKSTTESRLHPYDENTAYNLEEEYKKAVTTNSWSRQVDLPTGDYVIMYGPSSMALFQSIPQTPEGWEAEPDYTQAEQRRPKIIKRGVLDDFDIDEGESETVDHLIFVVHGIGSVCDFRFRTIEEAGGDLNEFLLENTKIGKVDGFRSKSLQLIKSHFRSAVDKNIVNRVEVLPVSWHSHLHGENTGVDKKLQTITLKSIPRLRHFTNDTLLDILFYTSPVYCQNIVQQVGREINNIYSKFKIRNPSFNGGVSLVGHSLGSLILFDMLCHQKSPSPLTELNRQETKSTVVQRDVTTIVSPDKKSRGLSRNVSYVIGHAGTGQPYIEYPQLSFQPLAFFALGSPIGMFVTVRGIDSLGLEFCLPTCFRFFNIFHPFDPVAYRIEALINPDLAEKRPVLIPHHKGRKRMHLELKETMARVGADLKQRLVDSVRSTWNTVYQLTMFGRADDGLEQEVDKVIEKQLERQRTESVGNGMSESEETDFNAGRLNQGRRIDYVLQEAPLESFNEYVSAITSHVIYWDSEDTMLLILKEIYGSMGISTDSQHCGMPGMPTSPSADASNISSESNSINQHSNFDF